LRRSEVVFVRDIVEGSRAVAEAVKLCDVKVISAYPITPQTHIVEFLAEFVANGELDAEYVKVESEHSAMSVCIGASATGVRTFTATSSQGLALMHEVLFIASGLRLPIVMVNANRAMSAPISIWNDQSDTIASRECGWIQLYVETNQEALDSVIQAYKVAENHEVLLPFMVCMDGFVLTHTYEPVDIPDKSLVKEYLPEYEPLVKLDTDNPITMGHIADPNYYMEFKVLQDEAMNRSKDVLEKADEEFGEIFGRRYGLFEEYKIDGADVVLVTMGSLAGTVKDVVDRLRERGKNVGLLRVRLYRPLPKKEIVRVLKDFDVVGVIEKVNCFGLGGGALFNDLKSIMYKKSNAEIVSFVAGLGGRDIPYWDIEKAYEICFKAKREEVPEVNWLGVRDWMR
jgi:pyruvate ferredoxin oxidoreductase alpha subunit